MQSNFPSSTGTPVVSDLKRLPLALPDEYRNGMRRLAVGTSIIAAAHQGQRAGLTATAVCSVTANPPRLVVCINKSVLANELIAQSGALSVNVLAGDQEEIAKIFAGMVEGVRGEARFNEGTWLTLQSGAPVLDNSLSSFDCRVIRCFDESTHNAYLCEVLAVRERTDGEALVYLNGGFHRLDLLG